MPFVGVAQRARLPLVPGVAVGSERGLAPPHSFALLILDGELRGRAIRLPRPLQIFGRRCVAIRPEATLVKEVTLPIFTVHDNICARDRRERRSSHGVPAVEVASHQPGDVNPVVEHLPDVVVDLDVALIAGVLHGLRPEDAVPHALRAQGARVPDPPGMEGGRRPTPALAAEVRQVDHVVGAERLPCSLQVLSRRAVAIRPKSTRLVHVAIDVLSVDHQIGARPWAEGDIPCGVPKLAPIDSTCNICAIVEDRSQMVVNFDGATELPDLWTRIDSKSLPGHRSLRGHCNWSPAISDLARAKAPIVVLFQILAVIVQKARLHRRRSATRRRARTLRPAATRLLLEVEEAESRCRQWLSTAATQARGATPREAGGPILGAVHALSSARLADGRATLNALGQQPRDAGSCRSARQRQRQQAHRQQPPCGHPSGRHWPELGRRWPMPGRPWAGT
mmetsp:Transcript_159200/g.510664  ORF Transcript_159200/g.510664 Transcript_159200/m.510664 type:complete len:451 (+) Transcript_159200:3197-4549(+)